VNEANLLTNNEALNDNWHVNLIAIASFQIKV